MAEIPQYKTNFREFDSADFSGLKMLPMGANMKEIPMEPMDPVVRGSSDFTKRLIALLDLEDRKITRLNVALDLLADCSAPITIKVEYTELLESEKAQDLITLITTYELRKTTGPTKKT